MLLLNRAQGSGGQRPPDRFNYRVASVLAVAALVAVVATVATRSTPGSSAAGRPPQHRPPPIDVIYETTPATHRVALAEHRLTSACMTRQGYQYRAAPPSDGQVADRPTPFGYETLPAAAGTSAPPAAETGTEDPAYGRALHGDPAKRLTVEVDAMRVSGPGGGCIAEAKQRLLGDRRARWMELQIQLFKIQDRALRGLPEDGRFRAATDRWRACVRERGFTWANPLEVQRDLPVNADPRTDPGTRADVECKQDTGYLADAYASLADAQRRELGDEPTALTEWQGLLRGQDEAATAVLNGAR
ncbi:hypothetical protein [Phytohabitans houttuyneae]|uniref:Uncharacterized protein n=1 Tax=Phytohabitans houttuyneae TaxID=1076126 RepID=A0A6V8KFU2_9ACTN|nr:hypothetical protein [Phytohabitans houttuyneae]GFJ81361.1 hypothetical protein Phou_055410 [Phytohabitans houttuyneae]